MIEKIADNPKLEKYLVEFEQGKNVFLEGDDSAEIYILISGRLDVLKGNQIIAAINNPGAIFGEMSFLLGGERTATVRARTDSKAVRIPHEHVEDFLVDFPEISQEMTKILARRLDKSSRLLFGFKEMLDQLPDAVVLSDEEGQVMSLNRAAGKLYGLEWPPARQRHLREVFQDPDAFQALAKRAKAGDKVVEQTLAVEHPQEGTRHVSLSLSPLHDAKHKYQGLLSMGRDVTSAVTNKRRLGRMRRWLMASLALLALFAVAALYSYPDLRQTRQQVSQSKMAFKNQLGKDFVLLKSLLAQAIMNRDQKKTSLVMERFFSLQDPEGLSYSGLVILDPDKKVLDAHSLHTGAAAKNMVGSTYGRIKFEGEEDSLHKVLRVYRQVRGGGSKASTEVAFEILENGRHLGWLIFVIDEGHMKKLHGVDREILLNYQFPR